MNITVYTTSTCPYCVMVKEFLDEHKIPYAEKNVQEDRKAAEEMIKKSGQMGVPVTDIDGQLIIGFDKEALKRALHVK